MINNIVDKIGEVVASMQNLNAKDSTKFGITAGLTSPYYFYGDKVDINKQLIIRDKDALTKTKKYPAIALRLPSPKEMGSGLVHCNINLAILDVTQKDWTSDDRFANVVKPVLYPLYELFLDRLRKNGFTWDSGTAYPDHTQREVLYYGTESSKGNEAHVFESPLDAIEILNLKINYTFKKC